MTYYATKEQVDQAEYARSIGGDILNYFEYYFNISYPLPKAGLFAVNYADYLLIGGNHLDLFCKPSLLRAVSIHSTE